MSPELPVLVLRPRRLSEHEVRRSTASTRTPETLNCLNIPLFRSAQKWPKVLSILRATTCSMEWIAAREKLNTGLQDSVIFKCSRCFRVCSTQAERISDGFNLRYGKTDSKNMQLACPATLRQNVSVEKWCYAFNHPHQDFLVTNQVDNRFERR